MGLNSTELLISLENEINALKLDTRDYLDDTCLDCLPQDYINSLEQDICLDCEEDLI